MEYVHLKSFELPDLDRIPRDSLKALEASIMVAMESAARSWERTRQWLIGEPIIERDFGPIFSNELTHELTPYFMSRGGQPAVPQKSLFEYECCKEMLAWESALASRAFYCFENFNELLSDICIRVGVSPRRRSTAVGTSPDNSGGSVIYPPADSIESQMRNLFDFVAARWRQAPHLCAIVLMVGVSHIHPLADGNGRLSRVLYNWLAFGRVASQFYLPIYETSALSDGGFIIRVRLARKSSQWQQLVEYFARINTRFLNFA